MTSSKSVSFKFHPLALAVSLLSSAAYAETTSTNVQQLEAIKLSAEEAGQQTENSQSYKVKQLSTPTKLNLSPRETPQMTKVFTREYLDDRNINSFQELANIITGVSTSRTDERQSVFARGFQVDYYMIDGLPSTMNLGAGDLDLGIYDRLEVVKGANGLMTGNGNPAMSLNMIRKHANAKELTGNLSSSIGSWNSWSSSADISAPLNQDGSLRGRVYVKHSDEDSFMDYYNRERNVFYSAFDYDLSDKTTLSLGATYQELNRDGIRWGGTPAFYTDGTRTKFPRHLTVSSDWTHWNVNTSAVFASIKQNLFNDVNLNLNYTYRTDHSDSLLLYTAGRVDKATNSSLLKDVSVYASRAKNVENNVDLYVNAPFTLFNQPQELILGGSWSQNEKQKERFGGNNYTKLNYLNVDRLNYSDMGTYLTRPVELSLYNPNNRTRQDALYIAGRFQIIEPLKLIAGTRLSSWEYQSEDGKGNRKFDNQTSPYAGVVYDFAKDHSVFASYTEIFKAQNAKDVQGSYLDPITGKNYETGIKSEWFDGRLNTALSIFRIEQSNFAERIEGVFVPNTTEQAYRAVDNVKSKGYEFELDGEINENWSLNFGFANFEAKAKGIKVNPNNSRTTSNLFLKYDAQDWMAGAGLSYRSKIFSGTGVNRIDQGEVFLADLMLGYKIDKNINLQLNVDNLFDKVYYDGIGLNSMNYALPRNATLSVRYNF